jgi:hypothetical protein
LPEEWVYRGISRLKVLVTDEPVRYSTRWVGYIDDFLFIGSTYIQPESKWLKVGICSACITRI